MRFRAAEPLPQRLLEAVRDCPALKARGSISIEAVESASRHVSQVHQVRVRFRSQPEPGLFWVKLHSDNPGGARQEFEFLRSAQERFREIPNLDVAPAVVYLDEFDALVTEHVSGLLLSSHVKRHANRISRLVTRSPEIGDRFHSCGVWLAALHQPRASGAEYVPREDVLTYVDERLRKLLHEQKHGELYQRLRDFVEGSLAAVDAEDLVRVKTHGDYAPYNVLLRGEDLVVFDPSVGHAFGKLDNYCPRYEDVVHFNNWASEMFAQMVSANVRRELVRRFLHGYNENAAFPVDPSSPAFQVFLLKYKLFDALDTWPSLVTLLSTPGARVAAFRRWFEQTNGG